MTSLIKLCFLKSLLHEELRWEESLGNEEGLCRDGVRKQAQALVYRSTANAGSSGFSEATSPKLPQHIP